MVACVFEGVLQTRALAHRERSDIGRDHTAITHTGVDRAAIRDPSVGRRRRRVARGNPLDLPRLRPRIARNPLRLRHTEARHRGVVAVLGDGGRDARGARLRKGRRTRRRGRIARRDELAPRVAALVALGVHVVVDASAGHSGVATHEHARRRVGARGAVGGKGLGARRGRTDRAFDLPLPRRRVAAAGDGLRDAVAHSRGPRARGTNASNAARSLRRRRVRTRGRRGIARVDLLHPDVPGRIARVRDRNVHAPIESASVGAGAADRSGTRGSSGGLACGAPHRRRRTVFAAATITPGVGHHGATAAGEQRRRPGRKRLHEGVLQGTSSSCVLHVSHTDYKPCATSQNR